MQSSITSSSVGGGGAEAAEAGEAPLRFLLLCLLLLLLLLLLWDGADAPESLLLPLLSEDEAPVTPRLRKRRKLALTIRSSSCVVVGVELGESRVMRPAW